MNISASASAMQNPLKQTSEIMRVTHYPTPPSVPAAAAAAAAMHAGSQHQRPAQIQEKAGSHLDASSPLTVSPSSSSRSPSPTGTLGKGLKGHINPTPNSLDTCAPFQHSVCNMLRLSRQTSHVSVQQCVPACSIVSTCTCSMLCHTLKLTRHPVVMQCFVAHLKTTMPSS